MRLDYTSEVRRPAKWLAISLLAVAMLTSTGCLALVIGLAIVGGKGLPVGAFWGCVLVFSFLTAASGWVLIRLLRDARARNGRTTIPEWFIQAFGVLLLSAICVVALTERNPLLLVEAGGVALAMISIRSLLRPQGSEESED